MKLRIFILLSLLFHFALLWLLHPRALPVQDLTDIQVVETLTSPTVSQRSSKPKVAPAAAPQAKVPDAAKVSNAHSSQESTNEPSTSVNSPAVSATANPIEAVSVGSVTDAPKVLKEKKIEYPLSARRADIEGVVELKLIIDREGRVQEAQLIRGPGYGLDEAALGAIREFIFSPALIGNEKVPVRIIYKYRFKLGGT